MLYLILFVAIVGYYTSKRNNEPTIYYHLYQEMKSTNYIKNRMMHIYRLEGYDATKGLEHWQEAAHRLNKFFGK